MLRFVSKITIWILCLGFIFTLTPSVKAVTPSNSASFIDWNEIDWASFDWNILLEDPDKENAWYEWLHTDASIESMFVMSLTIRETLIESLAITLSERFYEDPYGMLNVLASERKEVQQKVIRYIVYGSAGNWDSFILLLDSIELSSIDNKATKLLYSHLLQDTSEWAQENKMPTPIPKTADNAHIIAALLGMLACGSGAIFIRKKTI